MTPATPSPLRPPVDDNAVVAAVRAGDVGSFAELYRRHADRLYALFTRLVGPVSEREDLIQETFVDAYRALPGFRGDCAFATFLHRIAVRVGCDFLARRSRRATTVFDPDALEALTSREASPEPTPEDNAEWRLELARAFRLLDSLTAKRRAAFVLVAVEGLSLAEAARAIGVDEQAVKQRVLSARKQLLAALNRTRRRFP